MYIFTCSLCKKTIGSKENIYYAYDKNFCSTNCRIYYLNNKYNYLDNSNVTKITTFNNSDMSETTIINSNTDMSSIDSINDDVDIYSKNKILSYKSSVNLLNIDGSYAEGSNKKRDYYNFNVDRNIDRKKDRSCNALIYITINTIEYIYNILYK